MTGPNASAGLAWKPPVSAPATATTNANVPTNPNLTQWFTVPLAIQWLLVRTRSKPESRAS